MRLTFWPLFFGPDQNSQALWSLVKGRSPCITNNISIWKKKKTLSLAWNAKNTSQGFKCLKIVKEKKKKKMDENTLFNNKASRFRASGDWLNLQTRLVLSFYRLYSREFKKRSKKKTRKNRNLQQIWRKRLLFEAVTYDRILKGLGERFRFFMGFICSLPPRPCGLQRKQNKIKTKTKIQNICDK